MKGGTTADIVPLHGHARGAAGSRFEAAYLELKRRILTLELAPREAFTESEVAAVLGTSKSPVREALARLRRDGLVESAPRSGYRVSPMTVKDARDLFNLRTILEAEAAALAARQGGDDLEHLRELDELCRGHYDPADRASIARFLAVNAEFHIGVARLAGNRKLTDALASSIEQLERYMQLALSLVLRAEEIVHEHRDLLTAIMSGDHERARQVALAQAQSSHRMVLEALLSSEVVQETNLAAPVGGRS